MHLLAYTLVRAVMAQAASFASVLARALSFKGAMQLLNAYQQQLRHRAGARTAVMIAHALALAASFAKRERIVVLLGDNIFRVLDQTPGGTPTRSRLRRRVFLEP